MTRETAGMKPSVRKFTISAMAVGIIVGPRMELIPFWYSLSDPAISLVFVVMLFIATVIVPYPRIIAISPYAGRRGNLRVMFTLLYARLVCGLYH